MGLAVMAGLVGSLTPVQAQTVPLTPGYYEVTVSGLPGGRSEERPRCVTTDHLISPEAVFTYAFQRKFTPNPATKVLNFSAQDGKIRYDVETATSLIHVDGTLSNTSFAVERTAKAKSGRGAPIAMRLEGKRSGECKKE
jgi:hypothetical protein